MEQEEMDLSVSKLTLSEIAELWMHTKGGRMIMRDLYAIAAGYVRDWKRTGVPVSIALVYELERHKIKQFRTRAQRMNVKILKTHGYRMSNNHRAYIARHMMDRRPEWAGLFEIREVV